MSNHNRNRDRPVPRSRSRSPCRAPERRRRSRSRSHGRRNRNPSRSWSCESLPPSPPPPILGWHMRGMVLGRNIRTQTCITTTLKQSAKQNPPTNGSHRITPMRRRDRQLIRERCKEEEERMWDIRRLEGIQRGRIDDLMRAGREYRAEVRNATSAEQRESIHATWMARGPLETDLKVPVLPHFYSYLRQRELGIHQPDPRRWFRWLSDVAYDPYESPSESYEPFWGTSSSPMHSGSDDEIFHNTV